MGMARTATARTVITATTGIMAPLGTAETARTDNWTVSVTEVTESLEDRGGKEKLSLSPDTL
jgi:hypothetical protein